jgi:hypothetical protein
MSVYGPTGLLGRIAFRPYNDGFYGTFGEDCQAFRLPPDWQFGMGMRHYRQVWDKLPRECKIALRRLRDGMEVYRWDGMPVIDENSGGRPGGLMARHDFREGDYFPD